MNPWLILAALIAIVAVVLISRAVRPGAGRRRAPAPVLRPVEVLDKRMALCPVEGRVTEHAFLRLGGRSCMTAGCRATTPTGGPR